jgi:hypothetical protein
VIGDQTESMAPPGQESCPLWFKPLAIINAGITKTKGQV